MDGKCNAPWKNKNLKNLFLFQPEYSEAYKVDEYTVQRRRKRSVDSSAYVRLKTCFKFLGHMLDMT